MDEVVTLMHRLQQSLEGPLQPLMAHLLGDKVRAVDKQCQLHNDSSFLSCDMLEHELVVCFYNQVNESNFFASFFLLG